uniref:Immunoglobulin V-set domain-containing protein n=1 Tax=Moschus moschiferus TaxID=68415 RepID=A0A8C6FMK3_MOSMO
MNLACEILASFLLIFTVPTKGEDPESTVIWGALDHDLNLDIPGFQRSDMVADIYWNKNKDKIARIRKETPLYEPTAKYDLFTNGTLKIKTLMRNDSGLYKVEVYNSKGVNLLSKKFYLKIQGKTLTPK